MPVCFLKKKIFFFKILKDVAILKWDGLKFSEQEPVAAINCS